MDAEDEDIDGSGKYSWALPKCFDVDSFGAIGVKPMISHLFNATQMFASNFCFKLLKVRQSKYLKMQARKLVLQATNSNQGCSQFEVLLFSMYTSLLCIGILRSKGDHVRLAKSHRFSTHFRSEGQGEKQNQNRDKTESLRGRGRAQEREVTKDLPKMMKK